MTNTQKLHAYLAKRIGVSRRKAEELIIQEKVRVNGEVAHVGQRIDPSADKVVFAGQVVKTEGKEEKIYILVNKPRGIISTTSDEHGRKNILSLIPEIKTRLFPVGRLDKESEGLMLLTNDGEFAYKFTHPKFEIPKTYEVLVYGKPTKKALELLRSGVKLKDGRTKPAKIDIIKEQNRSIWISITITEGRNRQIRRMMGRVGHEVLQLVRIKMGPFSLKDLKGKQVKYLDPKEDIHNLLPLS